jgi:hypothetical protein
VRFCHYLDAGELIRLSTRLSLNFGSPVDSRVVVGCLKLVRLSERLSHISRRLSWPFAQLEGPDANKYTCKTGYFHAAG